jgi:hypothetical protein
VCCQAAKYGPNWQLKNRSAVLNPARKYESTAKTVKRQIKKQSNKAALTVTNACKMTNRILTTSLLDMLLLVKVITKYKYPQKVSAISEKEITKPVFFKGSLAVDKEEYIKY